MHLVNLLRALALLCIVSVLLPSSASADESRPLSGPWRHQDIGATEVPGTAVLKDGVFTIAGTLDTWGTNDGFHFVSQALRGDGEIVARVLSVENTLAHAKGGLMMREDLGAGARHAQACVTPVDGAQFLVRTVANDKTTAVHTGANKGKLPYWVKLVRAGDKFTGFESLDGKEWSVIGSTNISMKPEIQIGLTASSHVKTKLCTATFDHVTVAPAAR